MAHAKKKKKIQHTSSFTDSLIWFCFKKICHKFYSILWKKPKQRKPVLILWVEIHVSRWWWGCREGPKRVLSMNMGPEGVLWDISHRQVVEPLATCLSAWGQTRKIKEHFILLLFLTVKYTFSIFLHTVAYHNLSTVLKYHWIWWRVVHGAVPGRESVTALVFFCMASRRWDCVKSYRCVAILYRYAGI